MRKTTLIYKMSDNKSQPAYPNQKIAMDSTIPEGTWIQAVFSNIENAKSDKQLGYLYSAIYPHFVAHYMQTQGYIFQIQKGNELIDIEPNTISVDLYLKALFSIHKSTKEFKKELASVEDLKEYINFLDMHSIQKFGFPIPEANKKEK